MQWKRSSGRQRLSMVLKKLRPPGMTRRGRIRSSQNIEILKFSFSVSIFRNYYSKQDLVCLRRVWVSWWHSCFSFFIAQEGCCYNNCTHFLVDGRVGCFRGEPRGSSCVGAPVNTFMAAFASMDMACVLVLERLE